MKTLEEAKKLKPLKVCPGHGPSGDATMLDNQQEFFKELLSTAKTLTSKSPAEVKESVEAIKKRFTDNERIKPYVGDGFPAQLEKALVEIGGKKFLSQNTRAKEEQKHVHAHGHDDHEHIRIVSPSLRRSK